MKFIVFLSKYDSNLCIINGNVMYEIMCGGFMVHVVYVDDILFIGNNEAGIYATKSYLH